MKYFLSIIHSITVTDVLEVHGVLIAVEGSLSSQLIDCPKELELLVIKIGIKHPTRICLVYNPPNSCVEYKRLYYSSSISHY